MEGERLGIQTEKGLKKVKWEKFSGKAPGITWYQVMKKKKYTKEKTKQKKSDYIDCSVEIV